MLRIIISLLTLPLISCDYINNTRVCNKTGKDITLKITFDSAFVTNWGLEPKEFTRTFHNGNENLKLLDFDTINYASIGAPLEA